jgi:hypothetical protein
LLGKHTPSVAVVGSGRKSIKHAERAQGMARF